MIKAMKARKIILVVLYLDILLFESSNELFLELFYALLWDWLLFNIMYVCIERFSC